MVAELTVAQVKEQLPQVQVRHGAKVYWAQLSGRLNPQATVSLGYSTAVRQWIDLHFAWEAVARAVNSGSPLQA